MLERQTAAETHLASALCNTSLGFLSIGSCVLPASPILSPTSGCDAVLNYKEDKVIFS